MRSASCIAVLFFTSPKPCSVSPDLFSPARGGGSDECGSAAVRRGAMRENRPKKKKLGHFSLIRQQIMACKRTRIISQQQPCNVCTVLSSELVTVEKKLRNNFEQGTTSALILRDI